ncbi:unnamed protein product [Phytomonas sp. EM1]|nr:unnamed protein product [Phytomonas sp. EM1]|eukprot:CCW63043.1 unnamed protein product [Phytomonas sp. isolate EM1]
MVTWSYIMAVITPPGTVPSVFQQRSRSSAALALATFYEPLTFRKAFPADVVEGKATDPNDHRSEAALYPPLSHRSALGSTMVRVFPANPNSSDESADSDSCGPLSDPGSLHETFFFNPSVHAYTSVWNSNLNFCPVCARYKPPRAHHCRHCNCCVLKYDHHCPWLGQCVGFFNYKNYLLVVLYSWLSTAWVLMLLSAAIVLHVLAKSQTSAQDGTLQATGLTLGSVHGNQHNQALLENTLAEASPQCPLSVLEALRVGAPSFGVFVCFTEALLFFVMTSYLLKRHYTYARHNITSVDLVIHQRRRYDGYFSSTSSDSEIRSSGDTEGTGDSASASGELENADKNDLSLKRFMRKNVYDLGVRRNLLHVFGDAKLHTIPTYVANGVVQENNSNSSRSYHHYRDFMESDVQRYSCFILRWWWRLLPFPAFPSQMSWTPARERRHLKNAPAPPAYGSISDVKVKNSLDKDEVDAAFSASSNSILEEYGVTGLHLLGLRFPTKDSLGL